MAEQTDGRLTPLRRVAGWLTRTEDSAVALALAAMTLLPLAEIVARSFFESSVPGSHSLVRHLGLFIAFAGAAIAAREGKLLALATGQFLKEGRARTAAGVFAAGVGALVCTALADASWQLVTLERELESDFAVGWPLWIPLLVMPLAIAAIGVRLVLRSGRWPARAAAAVGVLVGVWLVRQVRADEYFLEERPLWPWMAAIALATAAGGPLFVAIGGAALFLLLSVGDPASAIPAEAYRMAASPHLPAIPLFTLAGFLLGEGAAPQRLLRLFRATFGWMPGGTAIVCAVLCAFLTVFTGGSGVTILVAGGILYAALREDGYPENTSLGLLTASGSLGLLLPPALPLILYAVVAEIPVEKLFLGGLLPGLLLIVLIAAWGAFQGRRAGVERRPFDGREARSALWSAKFELALPILVLALFFGGFVTLLETAALTAAYAFFTQTVVHRDVPPREWLRVFRECGLLVGGVLLILGVSMGLTNYLVIEQIPMQLVDWATEHLDSRWTFLLALNVFLLAVGCLMDVFSATVVVVPLIVPLGQAFGIDPVHLGIIFVANLELGYLTPPVGLNLFLASYRFEKPLLTIYRAAIPMLVILGIGVLVITYCPALVTALVPD